jgi:hypothetical protein
MCDYGDEKKKQKKGTMSYVAMFGYGRGRAHYNAHTWVGLIFFQKTNINKMKIKY